MTHIPKKQQIDELLIRGVEHVYPKPEFLAARLAESKPLTLYTGYDPTADTLHIGHGISLLKLRQFQELGHKVIMLIGDFTGMIGDPTDKSAARKKLTREEVLKNCVKYKEQAAAILDFEGKNPAEIKFNSEWLGKMNFADVLELAAHFTVQQMLQRDMFQRRYKGEVQCPHCSELFVPSFLLENYTITKDPKLAELTAIGWGIGKGVIVERCTKCEKNIISEEDRIKIVNFEKDNKFEEARELVNNNYGRYFRYPKPIYLHEFLYPLMQGYDSVAMDVDGEVGGNDQTFNMLAGRTLMKEMTGKEKFVLTVKLLADDSGKKMGKSEGNMIALSDSPEDMFGKVMRWSDGMIKPAFELCTRVPMAEIDEIMAAKNPRDAKLRLAFEITKQFLGVKEAEQGKKRFEEVVQKKEIPTENIEEYKLSRYSDGVIFNADIISVLLYSNLCLSRTDARRQLANGGVYVNGKRVEPFDIAFKIKPGDVVKKGPHSLRKIV